MGGTRNIYMVLVGKSEGKTPLGKRRRNWENNLKIRLKEIRWGHTDWIQLAQDRDQWSILLNTVLNLWVP
jgi:hypothetical protein